MPRPLARLRAPLLLALLLAAPAALARPALAQAPHADWRTVETGRFRVHYPARSEAWARHAAARLESTWARVEEEVGYRPPDRRIDVVVSDPVAQPNGAALPFLGWPRMILWTSPPGPESVIGHYTGWADLLLVHEGAHLVHLLRRSRSPRARLLAPLLPVGPLTLRSPRWVSEGYATVVEGRLTGSGRPHGDLRAAILRRRAQRGRLPGYGALDDDPSWYGSSMAYLMGSAYLEWLDGRAGPGSLPKLWARMSARERRTFDEAFEGVYGDSPADLYGRFTAELTHRSLEAERALAPALAEGELWQDLSWSTGAPALSPAGDRLAVVLRSDDDPDELVVWETAPDEEAEREWRKKREEIARRDPEDVLAVRTKPLARDPLFRLPTVDGIAPASPRFLPGGRSILFVRFEPDAEGFLHPDLFRWDVPGGDGKPGKDRTGTTDHAGDGADTTDLGRDRARTGSAGRVVRLTREADLREPDPGPDGAWAVALRNRDGLSQVVRVDLETGAVEPLTEATVETVYDQPRVAPDGTRVAFVLHREGLWRLSVRDLATGEQTEISPPEPGATVASPAWSHDGETLYASVGNHGYIDVWAFPLDGGDPARVTRVHGAALSPEPTPDGQGLFFLSLEPDGLDLRRIGLAGQAGAAAGPAPGAEDLAGVQPSTIVGSAAELPSTSAGPAPAQPAATAGSAPGRSSGAEDSAAAEQPSVASTALDQPRTTSSSAAPSPAVEPPRAEWAPAIAPPRPLTPQPFDEAEVPPGRPYGLGRLELLTLSSGTAASAGFTAELGVRLGDIVGRLDLLALGSPGGDGAPEGGAVAAAWRGWPVALSFHLFAAEESPSDQRGDLPLDGLPLRALDLDRTGAELRAAWDRRYGPAELTLAAGALWIDTDPRLGESQDETVAFAEAGYGASRGRGKWRLEPSLWGHWERGDGAGDAWERIGGALSLGIRREEEGLALTWRRDDSGGTFRSYQIFQVGGPSSSLLPRAALANRIRVPALPVGTLTGFEHEGQRADLQLGFLPVPLFYERHRVGAGGDFGDWLALAGIEWELAIDPQPLGRLPGLDLRLGVARILDSPLPGRLYEDDTRWWLTLVQRP